MLRSMPYYYEDIWFQLELNLQTTRRDIIKFLEEYKFHECFQCNRIKCSCPNDGSSFRSTTLSIASDSSNYRYDDYHELSMGTLYMAAPPATSLPTPEWPVNEPSNGLSNEQAKEDSQITIAIINSWIRASIPKITLSNARVYFPVPDGILSQMNYSWPPFPQSIWSKERLQDTVERENMIFKGREADMLNTVEAFFKHFSKSNTLFKPAAKFCIYK